MRICVCVLALVLPVLAIAGPGEPAERTEPSRPTALAFGKGGENLVVLESGTNRLAVIDVAARRVSRRFDLVPALDHSRCFAVSPDGRWTAAIEPWQPRLLLLDGDVTAGHSGHVDHRLPRSVTLEGPPESLAITPDSRRVLVACDAQGRAGRRIAIVDVESGNLSWRTIPGTSNLRGLAIDPQGRFALAAHLVHKSNLPSTQIEQGWVFTNALTWLSLEEPAVAVTVPLDLRTRGYSNPEGVAIAPDGKKAYIAHAGADLVSVVDLAALEAVVREALERAPPERTAEGTGAEGNSEEVAVMLDDLRATRRYVRARIAVGANPRGIAVSRDGRVVAVANRLSDSVSLIDAAAGRVVDTVALAAPPSGRAALVARGEALFHSGRLALSGQFSCASCHPDGHTDGLNWDLPADGFNNFHNTKSLLAIAGTAPYGWLGTSATLRDRFTGTLRSLFQHEPSEEEVAALEAYLEGLQYPQRPGPQGTASAAARGKTLFETTAGCADCHRGSRLTDRAVHDVGTGGTFDTPALVRVVRTGPWLHDGRAESIREIFTRHNESGQHGRAAELSGSQLEDLLAYLETL